MVILEKIIGGGWKVSRVMPCGPSMQAAATALEAINPAAFQTVKPDDTHGNTHAPPSAAEIAQAALRERVEAEDAGDFGLTAGGAV